MEAFGEQATGFRLDNNSEPQMSPLSSHTKQLNGFGEKIKEERVHGEAEEAGEALTV